MAQKLVLFDLPSKGRNASWSLNPWKTRLVLNFKGVDYTTEWVEYPDIEPRLKDHVPPNSSKDGPFYTIPTVQFPDGTYMADSKPIAAKLEELYPTPSLHLESPLAEEVQQMIAPIRIPLTAHWMPRLVPTLLNEKSAEYFERTRAKRVGMPVAEYGKTFDAEKAWKEATPGVHKLAAKLKENGGPYFMGKTPSYADFIIVGFLQFFKRIDEEGLYKKLVDIEPVLGELYEACGEWLKRDDH